MDLKEQAYQFIEMMYRAGKNKGHHRFHTEEDQKYKMNDVMFLRSIHMMNDGKPVKMSQLSKHFQVTPAAVSQTVRRLEDNGLIERTLTDSDRRSVYIQVSKKAQAEIKEKENQMLHTVMGLLKYLGAEDTKELFRITQKIDDYMQDLKETNCRGEQL